EARQGGGEVSWERWGKQTSPRPSKMIPPPLRQTPLVIGLADGGEGVGGEAGSFLKKGGDRMTNDAYGSELQPFAGIASFMRRPVKRDVQPGDVAIVGVPFDSGTSYRSGARFGPRAIREASLLLWGYNNALEIQPLEHLRVVDTGDVDVIPPSLEDTYHNIETEESALNDRGATLIALGGYHSVSLPLLRAHHARHGPLSLIHIDAHPDTWPSEYGGGPHSHRGPRRRGA